MAQASASTDPITRLTVNDRCAWPSCRGVPGPDSIFCPDCLARMAERRKAFMERLSEEATERLPEYIAEIGIPEKYRGARIEEMKLLPAKYGRWAREYADRRGSLYLCPCAGSGKTYFAAAVLRAIVETEVSRMVEHGELSRPSAAFVNVPALLTDLRSLGMRASAMRVKTLIARAFIVLDDMGAESISDWTGDILYQIVNGRYNEGRPLIVTSNLMLEEIGERLHERLSSRLYEMCRVIEFPKRDLRKEIR